MKQVYHQLHQFYTQLSNRDRIALILGLLFLGVFLFDAFVISPLHTSITTRTNALNQKKATVTWLQTITPAMQALQKQKPLTNARLLSLLGSQIHTEPLNRFGGQIEQTNQGEAQLSFDAVPYNALLAWLWTLNTAYAIHIKQVTLNKTDRSGLVKAVLVLAA